MESIVLDTNIKLGVFDLILQAGPMVQFVILILFIAIIFVVAVFLLKRKVLLYAEKQNREFLDGFWGGWNMEEAFSRATDFKFSPIAKVFRVVIYEMRKLGKNPSENLKQEVAYRSLRKANSMELSSLEYTLPFLAIVANSAPFVGLFGTVWGIMNSFQAIGATGNANLAAVAPGISEALIATALGLAAAIPAGIFYNLFLSKIRIQATELDSFSQDVLNLLQREGD